eukprot:TRINITY_DN95412_c0_g1_i1.p1 TRINITY_DN95412_c0_g1~~TRINITY_DN95412_c0_g1_i1.p1  ORF type:complete len:233 (-),score=41.38 TRINITY_DN95412_c0_g1_i1:69-725(-)
MADATVEDALAGFATLFTSDEKAADFAKLTNHVLEKLRDPDSRAEGVQVLIQLQDQLSMARRCGNYVKEANMVEAITGRMRSDDSYTLQSTVPQNIAAERSPELQEMINLMEKTDLEARPYEFVNQADTDDMTVNIKVPPGTKMADVSVKLTAKTIRVEVKGHEMQPCVIDGHFFKLVDTDGCDHHLEGADDKRVLVLDLLKTQIGMKWPDLLAYGSG